MSKTNGTHQPRNPEEMAAILSRAAVCFIPIKIDGSKAPSVEWKIFETRHPTLEESSGWFSGGKTRGIATICGKVSGNLEAIDLDAPALLSDFEKAVEEKWTGLLSRLLIVATPKGGRHYLYRSSVSEGNQKLAQTSDKVTLIETRGEGGYVVAPGSPERCHPTHKPYLLIQGDYGHIPTITVEERATLIDCARSFNQYIEPPPIAMRKGRVAADDGRPGASFNRAATAEVVGEMLTNAGWTNMGRSKVGSLWRRPGKGEAGSSATLFDASATFYVFSTNARPFEPRRAYSPFAVLALTQFNGDFKEAAKALAGQGLGGGAPESRGQPDPYDRPPEPVLSDDEPMSIERAREFAAPLTELLADSAAYAYDPEFLLAAHYLDVHAPGEFQDLERQIKRGGITIGHWRERLDDARPRPPRPEPTEPKPQKPANIEFTEQGAAEEVIRLWGADFRYIQVNKTWAFWNGKVWEQDAAERMVQAVTRLGKQYLTEASRASSLERAEACAGWGLKLMEAKRIRAIMFLAENLPGVKASPADFDAIPYVATCLNGVIDLKTGELRPHDRSLMCSKLINLNYDKNAKCPTWTKALQKIFQNSDEILTYFQRLCGLTASGSSREQILIVAYGKRGGNGKSKVIAALQNVLGPFSRSIQSESLMVKKFGEGINNDIASLCGTRFVSAIETERGHKLAVALLKQLSGADVISARFLYREFFEFRPTFTIWLICNDRPEASGSDSALWRRIHTLPFDVKFWKPGEEEYQLRIDNGETFDDDPVNGKLDYIADLGIEEKFFAEAQGILAWVVQGAQDWAASPGLEKPAAVISATLAYQAEMDSVEGFIQECCAVGDAFSVPSGQLIEAYKEYCRQFGHYALNGRLFGDQLAAARGGEVFKKERRSKGMRWFGLTLNSTDEREPD